VLGRSSRPREGQVGPVRAVQAVGPLEEAGRVIALRKSELDRVHVVHEFVAQRGQDRSGRGPLSNHRRSGPEPDPREREGVIAEGLRREAPLVSAMRTDPEQIQAWRRDVVKGREGIQELLAGLAQRRTLLRFTRGVELLHPGNQGV